MSVQASTKFPSHIYQPANEGIINPLKLQVTVQNTLRVMSSESDIARDLVHYFLLATARN